MTEPEPEIPAGGPVLDTVAGAAPVVLGLAAMWFGRDLGYGTLTNPGPGLWPTVVAVLLVITGAAIALVVRGGTESFTRGTAVVIVAVASLGLYAYVFELVGFEIPTVLLLVLWLRFFGRESWRMTAVVSVLATASAYALFITALGVPLPHLIVL